MMHLLVISKYRTKFTVQKLRVSDSEVSTFFSFLRVAMNFFGINGLVNKYNFILYLAYIYRYLLNKIVFKMYVEYKVRFNFLLYYH
jgi:hypothetical protein